MVITQCSDVPRVDASLAPGALAARSPVVITGAIDGWPARARWSLERLREEHGDWVVPVSVFPRGALHGVERVEMRMADFVGRVIPRPTRPLHYLQQVPLATWPPALAGELGPPPGLDPGTPRQIYRWCGPHGASSPLHYDGLDNLHALVSGHKRFVLFPPEQAEWLYPCTEPGDQHLSRVDLERLDQDAFPLMQRARGLRCLLKPGETLYLPAGWWHQVHLWAPGISVNFWWDAGAAAGRVPSSATSFPSDRTGSSAGSS